jgi:hypothetical protein
MSDRVKQDNDDILEENADNMTADEVRGSPRFHHEALDRSALVLGLFEDALLNHAFILAYPDLAEIAGEIRNKLGELYQAIGQLDPEDLFP